MKENQLSEVPGGTSSIMPWGDALTFFKNYHDYKKKKIEAHGETYKMKIFNREISVFLQKEALNFILVKQGKNFSSKQAWELSLKALFPNGLMLMDGEQHKHHRSIIAEAFKKKPMDGYLDMMKELVPLHIKNWKDPNPKLFPVLKAFTLEIALTVFFGIGKDNDFKKINTAISDIVEASSALPIKLPFTKFSRGLKARKYLITFFNQLLPSRKADPQKDLFSILATAKNEEGQTLNDEQIVDHLIFILMAAHDTTASTLTSFCYFLAKHPEWQQKLRAESMAFYSEHGNNFTVRDLRKLEQMGFAMKETLRRFPPLVAVGRVAQTDMEFDEFSIPQGTHASVNFDHNHHNPEIWSCPMRFDPERFSKERNEHNKCPYTYTPFGAGPHYCIGFAFAEMQIKFVMSQLVLTHEWSVPKDYEIPMKPVPLQIPEDGLPVQMKRLS